MQLSFLSVMMGLSGCEAPEWANDIGNNDSGKFDTQESDRHDSGGSDDTGSTARNTKWYLDSDGDRYLDQSSEKAVAEKPEDGNYLTADEGKKWDCDDSNRDVNPEARETRNGRDDDCDGNADDGYLVGYIDLTDAPDVPLFRLQAEQEGAAAGSALAAADVSGDGWPDLIVTVPGSDTNGAEDAGGVFIIPGPLENYTSDGSPGDITLYDTQRYVSGVSTGGRWGEQIQIAPFGEVGADMLVSGPLSGEQDSVITLLPGNTDIRPYLEQDSLSYESLASITVPSGLRISGPAAFALEPADAATSLFAYGVPEYNAVEYGGGRGLFTAVAYDAFTDLADGTAGSEAFHLVFYGDSSHTTSFADAMVFGELDGDGYSDAVFSADGNSLHIISGATLLNHWDRGMASSEGSTLVEGSSLTGFPGSFAVADLDGNARDELIATSASDVRVFRFDSLNVGLDVDDAETILSAPEGSSVLWARQIGDLDGDGKREFAVGSDDDKIWIFYELVAGRARLDSADLIVSGASHAVASADFNGDTLDDLAVADPEAENGAGVVYVLSGSRPS